jgi:hypothetical protein
MSKKSSCDSRNFNAFTLVFWHLDMMQVVGLKLPSLSDTQESGYKRKQNGFRLSAQHSTHTVAKGHLKIETCRIYSHNLRNFFPSLAAEKWGCLKYADFFVEVLIFFLFPPITHVGFQNSKFSFCCTVPELFRETYHF